MRGNPGNQFRFLLVLLVLALTSTACGRRSVGKSAETHGEAGEEVVGGAFYKNGRGVHLEEELRKRMGVETAEVSLRSLTNRVEVTAQVYRLDSRADPIAWQAVGLLPADRTSGLQPGQEVVVHLDGGAALPGRLRKLIPSPSDPTREIEVVVEFAQPAAVAEVPGFLRVTLGQTSTGPVMAVSRQAVLLTVEGAFVYAANGDAYQRTAVKLGAESGGFVEITDGLLEGDVVVTAAVEALYQIETQAVRGGGHCH